MDYNNVDALELLGEGGADLERADPDGVSCTPPPPVHCRRGPLGRIARNAHLCFGIPVPRSEELGAGSQWTPALLAAEKNRGDAIRCLHRHGVDLSAPNRRFAGNVTPVKVSAKNGSEDALAALQEAGVYA